MKYADSFSIDELMIVCFSREIRDGDMMVQGVGSLMVTASYMLAKLTHAPQAWLNFGVGNTVATTAFPLTLARFERDAIAKSVFQYSMAEAMMELTHCWSSIILEFLRPAQIDAYGNFNNTVIGDHRRPKVRLPGAAGIPDITGTRTKELYLYVPRHDRRTFVEKIDFRSGIGFLSGQSDAERKQMGITASGPVKVITNLCILGFDAETRRMKIESVHPGCSVQEIADNTGFQLIVPKRLPTTEPPTADEVEMIRSEIDPLGIRRLELLPSGKEREQLIHDILQKEANM